MQYFSRQRTSFRGQQAVGTSHYILRQIMPCIMFSEHERQQAAHYLHSTQISGLVSAGISFQVGMNLSIELRLGTPHALVDSSDTQKSLCSCVSSPYTLLLSIWICEICITSQIRGQHANCRKMQRVVRFFLLKCRRVHWEDDPLLPQWRSIKAKVSASLIVFLPCRLLPAWRRDVWCCFLRMTSGEEARA